MKYTKPCLTFEEQCELLRSRNLEVADLPLAVSTLRRISYYRLSAYFAPFRPDGEEGFKAETSFEDVLHLYNRDRELRMLLGDGLERIEVYLRTAITYHLALRGGPFAYCDPAFFARSYDHREMIENVHREEKRSREMFTRHFRTKYCSEEHLPIWMITELVSLGTLSLMYSRVVLEVQRAIAEPFGLDHRVLKSWFHFLTVVRNTCAHHGRVWDRQFKVRPEIPNSAERWPFAVDSSSSYCALLIIRDLVKRIDPECGWRDRVYVFLERCDSMQMAGMRLSDDWQNFGVWHEKLEP